MSQFLGRIARWTTALAVTVALAAGPSAAYAAGKRKGRAKKRKAVATERIVAATKRGQPNVQARASLVIDETGAIRCTRTIPIASGRSRRSRSWPRCWW